MHDTPRSAGVFRRRTLDMATMLRVAVGLIWLGGAAWNLLVTWRMDDPYGWIAEGARVAPWRWFFAEVVEAHRLLWTALLIGGETALGLLTLGRRGWARLGLAGGALFSAALFSFGTPYTLLMGPYALLLAWLGRRGAHRGTLEHGGGRRLPASDVAPEAW